MRLLLLASDPNDIPQAYLDKLGSWGLPYAVEAHGYEQRPREAETEFIARIAADVRSRYGDGLEFLQVFFDRSSWPLAQGTKGKQYHAFFSGYQVAIVRGFGHGLAGTAAHELMHSFDNFCRAYTGVRLERIVGVNDWDADIVHRRDPKTRQYADRFDDVFPVVWPFVRAAIAARAQVDAMSGIAALLKRPVVELRKLQTGAKPPEELPDDHETAVERAQQDVPAPPAPKCQTAAEKLYAAAYASIGRDMSNRAPDALGCADSLNNIHQKAFGFEIGGGTSTYLLYHALAASDRFAKVTIPQAGDIIICPSGYSSKGARNGHVGIVGRNTAPDGSLWVMSNDSFKGTWEANYTVKSWRAHFGTELGFPVHIYRLT
jgi:hypothetical protein